MSERIFRSNKEAVRQGLSWDERWGDLEKGLITCWERGRKLRDSEVELARLAENGELPPLVWQGGVDKELKTGEKYGTLFYLAQWQGLRGEDLSIDIDREYEHVCARFGVRVIFTGAKQGVNE